MILNILKGFAFGFILFVFGIFLWYLIDTSHIKSLNVKNCRDAPAHGIKALSDIVKNSWFERKHHDLQVYTNGECIFFQFYPKAGALYFGEEMESGYLVGTAMTSNELHQFADTIPAHTDFHTMLNNLVARAKSNPAPKHDFD